MANVNINIDQLFAQAGSDSEGRRMSAVTAATKAAQNDTITLSGANSIKSAQLVITATGASEPYTISGNVITLTSVTAGSVTGTILYN